MSKYIRPLIISCDSLAENVWATNLTSGMTETCWSVMSENGSIITSTNNDDSLWCSLRLKHSGESHQSEEIKAVVAFSSTLKRVACYNPDYKCTVLGNQLIISAVVSANPNEVLEIGFELGTESGEAPGIYVVSVTVE